MFYGYNLKFQNKPIAANTAKLCMRAGVDPTKLFFFVNEEFFRFLHLSLAVVQYTHFFICYKLSSLTAKIGKPEK